MNTKSRKSDRRKNMEDLKPCPFCGGKAVILYAGKYECFIRCRRGCVEQTKLYKSKRSAIKAWNRRKAEGETDGDTDI